jgi:methylated-DNA-[protein]-cysteine S-methyltransferase
MDRRMHSASEASFATFDTAVGRCTVLWAVQGIVGLRLPDGDEATLRVRLARNWPLACERPPPPAVQRAIDDIVALLRGEPHDLLDVQLDMSRVADFERRVYDIARHIPPGRVRSYGDIAAQLGDPALARAVGQALGRNPFPIVVPCHRVLAAGGQAGGFSAPGGLHTKLRLLTLERARLSAEPGLFDD